MNDEVRLVRFADFPGGLFLESRLHEALLALPAMTVYQEYHIGEIGGWRLDNGWIGAHFTAPFFQVVTKALTWYQPIVLQAGKLVNIGGKQKIISGRVVGIHCIDDNRSLLIMGNEPGAPQHMNKNHEEIHPILRQPLQFGMAKWDAVIRDGRLELDELLGKLVNKLGMGTFKSLKWRTSLHDTTRIRGETLVSRLDLPANVFNEVAELTGGMTFTPKEIQMLIDVGEFITPHTLHALI